jgi:4-hydroxy-tetrahydrodipicolinate synthase
VEKKKFEGIFPYLVSPLNLDGEVKVNVLENLVDHLVKSGIHGITLFGSTGELHYLNQKQKEQILRTVIKANNRRIPIIAGVSHFSTSEAINQAKEFEKLGVDGILASINIYFPLSQNSVYSYFQNIARHVNCPICIYHNPDFTKMDFSLDLIDKLSKVQNIEYIKYATSNSGKILSILNNLKDKIRIFSASANIPLLVLMFGGVGWMAGPACIIPNQCVELYKLAKKGEWTKAIKLQKQILQINNLFQKYNLAACIKAGLEIQGFPVGDPVPPQDPLSPHDKEDIKKALKEVFD